MYPDDINGDGWVVDMRIEHPSGTFVADAKEPRLLVPRQVDFFVARADLSRQFDGFPKLRVSDEIEKSENP